MKRAFHPMLSIFVTGLYLLMLSAPVAMQLALGTAAVVSECSGDCRICGCPPEASAANRCCCARKHATLAKSFAEQEEKSCCKKGGAASIHHDDGNDHGSSNETSISATACGKLKMLLAVGSDLSDHLPTLVEENIPQQNLYVITPSEPGTLSSRVYDPPDPPPKLSRTV